jgi:hypothetical protein
MNSAHLLVTMTVWLGNYPQKDIIKILCSSLYAGIIISAGMNDTDV